MEITKEVIEAQKLTDDQVTAINAFGKSHTDNLIAETKKEYDGKANEQANAIFDDVSGKIKEFTSVERDKGEKMADYYLRAWTDHSKTGLSELDKSKAEYDKKIADFKGDDETKEALEKSKSLYDELQKKTADYDKLKETADKYDPLQEKFSGMKLEVAFGNVKPSFHKDVNSYEADAKWNEFKSGVLKDNTIEIVENEAIAVDKENPHKTTKLKDLVEKDEELKKLTEGRKQDGTGAKETKLINIEGVPFEVPENADAKQRQEAIQKYLLTKDIGSTHPQYAVEFSKYNAIITKQQIAV